jgi:pimeloyl-ACP methyl ester carboxylesterase
MPKANINGINIDYWIEGHGESLVMISGFSSEKSIWRFQTESFKKHYRTITFDNRGVGKSDKPIGLYTTKMMADDTIGLMDHLRIDKAHVIGMSMGGMIAQELSINYPERVDKLVLASTFARSDEVSGFSSEFSKRVEKDRGSLSKEVWIRKVVNNMIDLTLNKRLYRISVIPIMKILFRLRDCNGLLGQQNAISFHDTVNRLGLIKARTLVITGADDRLIKPISSELIANLVPDAKLVKIVGGSHGVSIEMKNEYNKKVLDFLKTIDKTSESTPGA